MLKNDIDSLTEWYKNAIIYQIHVRSFFDSNDDGIGDFKGLIQKLDYIQFLGVNTIWLLPFYPSPLKDEGYDISDYFNVNPIYGSLNDFKLFLKEAHKRNLFVVTELVINHTSNQHQWFQRSRLAKSGSKWREYYVWSDTPERYQDARIIFKDFEISNWTWDADAGAYYWHRFYSHQPDLNYDNPQVQKEVLRILDFWFGLGVDGLRLDAIPYLYQREGTNCENLPETHQFIKKLRKHVDQHYKNKLLLAEANQWPDEAVAYFGEGDECQMAFHFPLMPRMFMAIQMEDRFPLIDILNQTPSIPKNCQWAIFLRNHDELTLEMVTDEERAYMTRMYGQDPQTRINLGIRRRLAPLLGGDRKKIELMNGLLFSLPGTPVIYYGDEIGMGDNIYLGDRNGVRTPMQWNNDHNAGFSHTTPQKLYLPVIIDPEYNYEAVNVELQKQNSQSLLWWMKGIVQMRTFYNAFGLGNIVFLFPSNTKILAFLRIYQDETLLVVVNLSKLSQYVHLDLKEFAGKIPIELFSNNEFPPIEESPYLLTLNPYSFFWFKLEAPAHHPIKSTMSVIKVNKNWEEIFEKKLINKFEKILAEYLYHCRWFKGKAQIVKSINIFEIISITRQPKTLFLLFRVEYKDIENENYLLPVTVGMDTDHFKKYSDYAIITNIENEKNESFLLVDACYSPEAIQLLIELSSKKKKIKGLKGVLELIHTQELNHIIKKEDIVIEPLTGDQSNTSVLLNHSGIFKFFRKIDIGTNPDVEITQFLTEQKFPNIPRLASVLEYTMKDEVITLAMMQEFIPNQGDAWHYTLSAISLFFEHAIANIPDSQIPNPPLHYLEDGMGEIPDEARRFIGSYSNFVQLLSVRTAELHVALSKTTNNKNFSPEIFLPFDQRNLYQSIYSQCYKLFYHLQNRLHLFPDNIQNEIKKMLDYTSIINEFNKHLLTIKIKGKKIRCHGDYHLGQVLYTGSDFFIIDFEGEPSRSLSERRIKQSPLRDVAGMLRSFNYAINIGISNYADKITDDQKPKLEYLGEVWYKWVCKLFIKNYIDVIKTTGTLPDNSESMSILLKIYLLKKILYEIDYEMNNRPEWISLPVAGLTQFIKEIQNK